jgi:hypothetical protein
MEVLRVLRFEPLLLPFTGTIIPSNPAFKPPQLMFSLHLCSKGSARNKVAGVLKRIDLAQVKDRQWAHKNRNNNNNNIY